MVKFNGFTKLTRNFLELILLQFSGTELLLKRMMNVLKRKLNSFIKICFPKKQIINLFSCQTQIDRQSFRLNYKNVLNSKHSLRKKTKKQV